MAYDTMLYDTAAYKIKADNTLTDNASSFEERFALLCEKVQRDFDGYMEAVAHMDSADVIKEAMKIAVMEEILSQLKNRQFDHPFEVEQLLYYDQPLFAVYSKWEKSEFGIITVVNETINGFLTDTREKITDMQAQYDVLSSEEQEKIMEYSNRELVVFDYLQAREIQKNREKDNGMEP